MHTAMNISSCLHGLSTLDLEVPGISNFLYSIVEAIESAAARLSLLANQC
jgi:hypothetical protein